MQLYLFVHYLLMNSDLPSTYVCTFFGSSNSILECSIYADKPNNG